MIIKDFEQWLAEEVEDTFGYVRRESIPALEEWLANLPEISLNKRVEMLRKLLSQNVDAWNEDELKIHEQLHLPEPEVLVW